ncbi:CONSTITUTIVE PHOTOMORPHOGENIC 3, HOOKLESS 1, UNUSUAL SUGAR RESPONSE 2 [Hibiscus trionum]|uniref:CONSTITUTIVE PHOTOMORPHOGENIC 3, HOOKLESS 1, UNUSUAL SUGAR RESPONSE 2 n=1 Tax=Hibiscus trionum TaxID=183268 RepID=A0A9W7HS56_HIBTR|nr:CONSTITUTIVE PHOTOMORPHOGENIC 3, HOOKLESS 1, UNUSUAL SUGAR RESPONSE 2 [Hibiscus trionum]
MSLKIAAVNSPTAAAGDEKSVVVREYDEEKDKAGAEEMERRCEIGEGGKPSLVADLLGDPICRVRHFPSHIMLVAEYGEEREIVGVIRGCIKTVTRGHSVYVKLAYILGLRVAPSHRRLGIGKKLVQKLEEWCKQNGAEYVYMATDCTNEASINLFTRKFEYTKFRTPTMLVQPVHAHYKPLGSGIAIVRLNPELAETLYRRVFANSEFFPRDIDKILCNKLSLGTFMALPKKSLPKWDPKTGILPPSFAVTSVWSTKQLFRLQVKGMPTLKYACCMASRVVDAWMPWLMLPSFPDVFRNFWVYFLYGLHMEGKNGGRLMKSLCAFAHNMGRDDDGCGAVVAEVGQRDPVREVIPHWRKFSMSEDLWCIKNFKRGSDDKCGASDWVKSRPSSPLIFVDPRDI